MATSRRTHRPARRYPRHESDAGKQKAGCSFSFANEEIPIAIRAIDFASARGIVMPRSSKRRSRFRTRSGSPGTAGLAGPTDSDRRERRAGPEEDRADPRRGQKRMNRISRYVLLSRGRVCRRTRFRVPHRLRAEYSSACSAPVDILEVEIVGAVPETVRRVCTDERWRTPRSI